mmetsp:Transcript_59097/g.139619  ORF Transcript_59097/g.139619 Transcript_59097/m.139619 type:complete len:444 (+) Transcript_59097:291-1622(+)
MHEHSLLEGVLEVLASVGALVAKLLLDTHELVVLGSPLRAARGAGLDLSRPEADNEVRDGGVLRLARTVRHHHAPPLSLGHLASLDRLRDRPDLVHLEEEGVARLLLETGGDARGVRHQKVIAHNLDLAHLGGHLGVRLPVVLVVRVLDSHHGVVLDEALVHFEHLVAIKVVLGLRGLVLEVKVVLAVLAELRGGNVHADLDLARVAGLLDGLDEELEAFVVGLDGGREAALVAHVARVLAVLLLDDALEAVVHLAAHLHRLLEGRRAGRADHELLHGKAVAGVGAAVDDVHPRHGHNELAGPSELSDVAVEGHALLRRAGLAHREGHREDRVGPELRLVGGPVEVHHLLVDGILLDGVHARDGRRDERLDVLDRLQHALAQVTRLVAIPKLASLVDPGGRARGNGTAEGTDVGGEVNLHGGVAAGVDDLASGDGLDRHLEIW